MNGDPERCFGAGMDGTCREARVDRMLYGPGRAGRERAVPGPRPVGVPTPVESHPDGGPAATQFAHRIIRLFLDACPCGVRDQSGRARDCRRMTAAAAQGAAGKWAGRSVEANADVGAHGRGRRLEGHRRRWAVVVEGCVRRFGVRIHPPEGAGMRMSQSPATSVLTNLKGAGYDQGAARVSDVEKRVSDSQTAHQRSGGR